jgi:GPH family glycoside/pentoside/hexuronide:cation symporter
MENKVSVKEKIAYAMGDASANIAWRGISIFMLILYTDVFGLSAAVVAWLVFIVRFTDGAADVFMGMIADRTKTRWGSFRPWILWTALPMGVILSMVFTAPDLSMTGKIIYAYATYIIFMFIYTANNIPYGALLGVMSGDDKERASIGSYRLAGAFAGGLIVQGSLLYLVLMFGNINPEIAIRSIADDKYEVTVIASKNVENVNISTKDGIADFRWNDVSASDTTAFKHKSFRMVEGETYSFIVTGQSGLDVSHVSVIDQKKGYSNAIYALSAVMVLLLFITFYYTRERVQPPKDQENNLKQDLINLVRNRPWVIMLIVGLLFCVYTAIKNGVIMYYFTHYIGKPILAASFMVCLMLASIAGAMATAYLSRRFGKKNLFIGTLLLSGFFSALIYFCGPQDIVAIFTLGIISEWATAIFVTLFFVMLADAADYSEYVNGRRATGLIYAAGSFSTKFGGGIGGAITLAILAIYGYEGDNPVSIQEAREGIVMLMSWVPAVVAVVTAALMLLYPLDQKKMDEITTGLAERRLKEKAQEA